MSSKLAASDCRKETFHFQHFVSLPFPLPPLLTNFLAPLSLLPLEIPPPPTSTTTTSSSPPPRSPSGCDPSTPNSTKAEMAPPQSMLPRARERPSLRSLPRQRRAQACLLPVCLRIKDQPCILRTTMPTKSNSHQPCQLPQSSSSSSLLLLLLCSRWRRQEE